MPMFSKISTERKLTCDPKLILVLDELIKQMDFIILCGTRTKAEQEDAFLRGATKVHYPDSKHNSLPSKAVDIAPYYTEAPHVRWPDRKQRPGTYDKELAAFYILATAFNITAGFLGVHIRSGFDWNSNWDIFDQNFDDLPHHELK